MKTWTAQCRKCKETTPEVPFDAAMSWAICHARGMMYHDVDVNTANNWKLHSGET